jgi:pimeloyl-ACP methyl ester carboxylesterase
MMARSQCAGRFFATYRASKLTHLLLFTLAATSAVARAEHRLVNIGDRRLSIDCDGDRSHRETVVLIAGLGRTAQDWAKVQPAVYGFARVCSYDRAGSGESDKVDPPQSIEQTVEDLHRLLNAAGEKAPYILVGHSIAGIYCRRYATRFPHEVAGFLFLDSSHEEQMWRLHEVDPKGPTPSGGGDDVFFAQGGRLDWHTNAPLIVIAQGKPGPPIPGLNAEQNAGFGRVWRELQQDLATRSPKSQFRVADQSGHFIQIDQPKLVVQAIRDLVQLTTR